MVDFKGEQRNLERHFKKIADQIKQAFFKALYLRQRSQND